MEIGSERRSHNNSDVRATQVKSLGAKTVVTSTMVTQLLSALRYFLTAGKKL